MLKIISFNINGLRARLVQLQTLIDKHQPDIIGLQEIKVADEAFPINEIEAMGYRAYFHGQKGHYGVALLSKQAPLRIEKGLPNDDLEAQRRFIAGTFLLENGEEITVVNCYFPQGESRDHPTKFPLKEKFYTELTDYFNQRFKTNQKVVLMGDMNVGRKDQDIGIGATNAKRWLQTGKCCFLPEERQWLENLIKWGFHDSFRLHFPNIDDKFSWFDYRSKGFEDNPKRGLRIDLILISEGLKEFCKETGIDYELRGLEKPSDHAPIWASFNFK